LRLFFTIQGDQAILTGYENGIHQYTTVAKLLDGWKMQALEGSGETIH
jgi:hypothetical protein